MKNKREWDTETLCTVNQKPTNEVDKISTNLVHIVRTPARIITYILRIVFNWKNFVYVYGIKCFPLSYINKYILGKSVWNCLIFFRFLNIKYCIKDDI